MCPEWWRKFQGRRRGGSVRMSRSACQDDGDATQHPRARVITITYTAGLAALQAPRGPPLVPPNSPRSPNPVVEKPRYRTSLHSFQENHENDPQNTMVSSERTLAAGFSRFLETHSASTAPPNGPYSSTDIIGSYNNDTARPSDENKLHASLDSNADKRRGSDLRPSSRKESRRSLVANNTRERANTIEKESRDSRERGRDEAHNTPHKQNYFKPTGVRNSFLTGHQALVQRVQPPPPRPTSRESDSLVAMGTLWNPGCQTNGSQPPPPVQRNGRMHNHMGNQGGQPPGGMFSNHSSAPPPITTSPFKRSLPPRAASNHQAGCSQPNRSLRESEPKYSDPANGAPPTFQQRIAELGALEADTVRWERARKLKKKVRGDS